MTSAGVPVGTSTVTVSGAGSSVVALSGSSVQSMCSSPVGDVLFVLQLLGVDGAQCQGADFDDGGAGPVGCGDGDRVAVAVESYPQYRGAGGV